MRYFRAHGLLCRSCWRRCCARSPPRRPSGGRACAARAAAASPATRFERRIGHRHRFGADHPSLGAHRRRLGAARAAHGAARARRSAPPTAAPSRPSSTISNDQLAKRSDRLSPPLGTSTSALLKLAAAPGASDRAGGGDGPLIDQPVARRVAQFGVDRRHRLLAVGRIDHPPADRQQFIAAGQPLPVAGGQHQLQRAFARLGDAGARLQFGRGEEIEAAAAATTSRTSPTIQPSMLPRRGSSSSCIAGIAAKP